MVLQDLPVFLALPAPQALPEPAARRVLLELMG